MEKREANDLGNPYCFEFEANSGMNRNDVERLYVEGLRRKRGTVPGDGARR